MLCSIRDGADAEVTSPPWRSGKPAMRTGPASPLRAVLPDSHSAAIHHRTPTEEINGQIEQRISEAREEGRQAGEAAARKKLAEEVHTALSSAAKTVADASASRSETIRRAEADIVKLAIEIARRILHRELSADPGALEGLVKAAIVKLQNQEIHRVRVHPSQEKLVRAALEQNGRGSSVEVASDSSLPPGGVSFEISRGTLDASVDTQLREIENGLADRIRRRT